MSAGTPYIGSKISLISKAEIRYEGTLYAVDTKESTVTLQKVKSFGTENRPVPKHVPPRSEIYEYIIFRGSDIKDLHVSDVNKQEEQPPDPAILSRSAPVAMQTGTAPNPSVSVAQFQPMQQSQPQQQQQQQQQPSPSGLLTHPPFPPTPMGAYNPFAMPYFSRPPPMMGHLPQQMLPPHMLQRPPPPPSGGMMTNRYLPPPAQYPTHFMMHSHPHMMPWQHHLPPQPPLQGSEEDGPLSWQPPMGMEPSPPVQLISSQPLLQTYQPLQQQEGVGVEEEEDEEMMMLANAQPNLGGGGGCSLLLPQHLMPTAEQLAQHEEVGPPAWHPSSAASNNRGDFSNRGNFPLLSALPLSQGGSQGRQQLDASVKEPPTQALPTLAPNGGKQQVPPAVAPNGGKQQAPLAVAPNGGKQQAPPAVVPNGGKQQVPPAVAPNGGKQVPPAVAPNGGKQQAPPAVAPNGGKQQVPPAVAPNGGKQQAPPAVAPNGGKQQAPPSVAPNGGKKQAPPALVPSGGKQPQLQQQGSTPYSKPSPQGSGVSMSSSSNVPLSSTAVMTTPSTAVMTTPRPTEPTREVATRPAAMSKGVESKQDPHQGGGAKVPLSPKQVETNQVPVLDSSVEPVPNGKGVKPAEGREERPLSASRHWHQGEQRRVTQPTAHATEGRGQRRDPKGAARKDTTQQQQQQRAFRYDREFDFESANARFDKDNLEEEFKHKLKMVDGVRKAGDPEECEEGELEQDEGGEVDVEEVEPQSEVTYDKSKSFFDNITCDGNKTRGNVHTGRHEERALNTETFGVSTVHGYRYGGGRGRGGGGYYRSRGRRGGSGHPRPAVSRDRETLTDGGVSNGHRGGGGQGGGHYRERQYHQDRRRLNNREQGYQQQSQPQLEKN